MPSAGVSLDWHFAPSTVLLASLSPMLDKMVDGEKQLFNIAKQDSFSVSINTQDGFTYGMEPAKVFVGFFHSLKARSVSGGPPVLQMLSYARPYTELLTDILKRLVEATIVVPEHRSRKVNRVGIVTTTTVNEDEAPPGIIRFLKHVSRPWGGSADSYSIQLVTKLGSASGWSDKCVHVLAKPEDPVEPMTLTFDWQRTFTTGQSINTDSLKSLLSRAEKDALQYFEELGEGTRFDDDVVGTTA